MDATVQHNAVACVIVLAGAMVGGEPGPDWDQHAPLKWFVNHRGVTHRLWLHVLLVTGVYFVVARLVPGWEFPTAFGLALGLASHVVADMMTPTGLHYLAPFYVPRDRKGEAQPLHVLPRMVRVCPTRPQGPRPYVPISEVAGLAPVTLAYGALVALHYGVLPF
jgi:hypothetical protein